MNRLIVGCQRCYKVLILTIVFGIFGNSSNAQDIQFSQFYAVTPYINPAFVGGAHALRAMVHGRYQWPGIDAKYATGLVSVDHFLKNIIQVLD